MRCRNFDAGGALKAIKNSGMSAHSDAVQDTVHDALSASDESVAAWEAEKLEPLQRQVAMLYSVIMHVAKTHNYDSRVSDSLSLTQATAEAYDRELTAKALEEFGEKYRCVYFVHRGVEVYVGPELKELADKEAAKLRAKRAQTKE